MNGVWFVYNHYIPSIVIQWGKIKNQTPVNEKSDNQQLHDVPYLNSSIDCDSVFHYMFHLIFGLGGCAL